MRKQLQMLSAILVLSLYWQVAYAQPEFTTTAEDLVLECGVDEVPVMEDCDGTDFDHQHSTELRITSNGAAGYCSAADNALGYSLNFPSIADQTDLGLDDDKFVITEAIYVDNGDGTADIKAEYTNSGNAAQKISVVMHLIEGTDWTGWSSQMTLDGLYNRSWKGDPAIVGTDYLDWDYFILDGANSYMSGTGDLEGFHAELSHYPVNRYYAVQIGEGANDIDATNGFGAWIEYDGTFDCEPVDGFFDSNFSFTADCDQVDLCAGTEFIIRCWTLADDCGYTAQHTQIIEVKDTTGPYSSMGNETYNVECVEDIPAIGDCDWADLCSGVASYGSYATDLVAVIEGCEYTLNHVWYAIDSCGNYSEFIHTYNTHDNTPPMFYPLEPVLQLQWVDDYEPEMPYAHDLCGEFYTYAEITLTHEIDILSSDDSCMVDWVITWTATDPCGNPATLTQIIEWYDEVAPEIECPAVCDFEGQDMMGYGNDEVMLLDYYGEFCYYQCKDDVPSLEEVQAEVIAWDECDDDVTIHGVLLSDDYYSDQWYGMVTYQFYAEDCNGNMSDYCWVTFTYWDTEAPVFSNIPADQNVDCYSDVDLPETLDVLDNCQEIVDQGYNDYSGGDMCYGHIYRNFWATDNCGNYTYVTVAVMWEDTIAPVFEDIAPEIEVEWVDDYEIPLINAVDACQDSMYTEIWATYNQFSGECLPDWEVTYHAMDYCGNYSSVTQIINWTDNVPPVFSSQVPPEVTYEWDAVLPPGECLAWDECDDNLTYSTSIDTLSGDTCLPSYVYHWYATDCSGNTAQASQIVHITDNTPPVFTSLPAEFDTLACDADHTPWNVTAEDGCDDNVVVTVNSYLASGGCAHTLVNEWTATDCSGNSAYYTQFIHLIDTVAPVITYSGVDPSIIYQCPDDLPILTLDDFSSTDNCYDMDNGQWDPEILIAYIDGYCAGGIIYTYIVRDGCENYAEYTVTLYYEDTIDPTFDATPAAEITLQWDPNYGIAECAASDNCDNEVDTWFTYNVFSSAGCLPAWEVTWYAEDNCENIATVSQVINWVDTIAPTFIATPFTPDTISCETVLAYLEEIADCPAEDDCDEDVETWYTVDNGVGDCDGIITITWYAEDDCENVASITKTINVNDLQLPVFTFVMADQTLNCNELDVFTVSAATATDNCDIDVLVNFTFVDTIVLANGWDYQFTIAWTAVDNCFNTISANTIITVVDNEGPYVVGGLDGYSYMDCDEIVVPEPEFLDNCTDVTLISFTETIGDCDYDYEEYCYCITWTWVVADDCGNEVTFTQVAMITDDEAPVFTVDVDPEIYVACDQVPELDACLATDNCSDDIVYGATEIIEGYTEPFCKATDSDDGYGLVLYPFTDDEMLFQIDEDGLDIIYADNGSFTVNGSFIGGEVLSMQFSTPFTWEEWSALGRSWKGDQLDGDPDSLHVDWSYFVLESGFITGTNTLLTLTHAPESMYYGYQIGMGANNATTCMGLGGWFLAEGLWDGEELACPGDLITCVACSDCDYTIWREWTATDECGNTATVSQIVHVGVELAFHGAGLALGVDDIEVDANKVSMTLAPNPAIRGTQIKVTPIGFEFNSTLTYQIIDIKGAVSSTNISRDEFIIINTGNLDAGMYTVRVFDNNNGEMSVERFIIQ